MVELIEESQNRTDKVSLCKMKSIKLTQLKSNSDYFVQLKNV